VLREEQFNSSLRLAFECVSCELLISGNLKSIKGDKQLRGGAKTGDCEEEERIMLGQKS
jgi:hypothetical protein